MTSTTETSSHPHDPVSVAMATSAASALTLEYHQLVKKITDERMAIAERIMRLDMLEQSYSDPSRAATMEALRTQWRRLSDLVPVR